MDVYTEVCHGQLLVIQSIRKMGASVGHTLHPCATSRFHMLKGNPRSYYQQGLWEVRHIHVCCPYNSLKPCALFEYN